MTNQGAVGLDALIVAPHGGRDAEPPEVSVIVPVREPGGPLGARLEALAEQTLAPARFEILLVVAGDAPDAAEAVAGFKLAHPDLRVRLCTMSAASPAEVRDIGLRGARGVHSIFVEEHHDVSTGLLEGLLRSAQSGAVPVARPSGTSASIEPHQLLLDALESGGVLVPTQAARRVRHSDVVGGRTGLAHCWELAALEGFRFRVAGPDEQVSVTRRPPARDADDFMTEVLDRLALIRHLQNRAPAEGAAYELAELVVTRQAEGIREYLVRHPERHGDVVEHVRDLHIPAMPWSVVNRGRAHHLALLYLFTPFLDTSALVAARRLRERGWVTDVVSQDVSNIRTRDPGADQVAAEVVDEARVLPGDLPIAQWGAVVSYAENALDQVTELEGQKGPYVSVYSRAMTVESHFAAAVLKLRRPGVRWVAEFSDPLMFNAYGQVRENQLEQGWLLSELTAGLRRAGHSVPTSTRLFEWAELICYALADEILFTNQHQRDLMLGYCADRSLAERAAGIAVASHHPVPSPDLYEAARAAYSLQPGKVHIGYFGNFYANRGLSEITGALNKLTPAERDRIQLHVFTSKPEALVLQTLELGLADVISVNAMLGFLPYLNLTTRFDVLLITDYATRPHFDPNPFLPAKLADYLGSGSKIWAVHEPGSVLSTFEVDYSSELGDEDSAIRVLRDLARRGVVTSSPE